MPRHVPFSEPHDELQRQQARVWAPAADVLFDRIGVGAGWTCADLGCGAVGVLPELSRRAGPAGRVIGLERDPEVAKAARRMAAAERLGNVEIVAGDLGVHPLQRRAFDLVHLRFVLHVPAPEQVIAEMASFARPGGFIAVQEPDLSTWRYLPQCPSWPRLLGLLAAAIARQGEPSVGSRVPAMMERAGLREVQARAVVLLLRDRHPYTRLPLCWAATQREVILAAGLAREAEVDGLCAELERHIQGPEVMMLTFTTIQAWGRKSG